MLIWLSVLSELCTFSYMNRYRLTRVCLCIFVFLIILIIFTFLVTRFIAIFNIFSLCSFVGKYRCRDSGFRSRWTGGQLGIVGSMFCGLCCPKCIDGPNLRWESCFLGVLKECSGGLDFVGWTRWSRLITI